MKVVIKRWDAVAYWHWDVPDDEVCGICRVQFEGTCPTCRYPGDSCPLIEGVCQHSFHMHCLLKWLDMESSRGLCPMCRQPFTSNSEETRAAVQRVIDSNAINNNDNTFNITEDGTALIAEANGTMNDAADTPIDVAAAQGVARNA